MKKYLILILVLCSAFAGCHKAVFDCQYKVYPLIKESATAKDTTNFNALGYAVYKCDTANWTVLSWEDAEKGVFTHRLTAEKRNYDLSATLGGDTTLTFSLTGWAMILVYDPTTKVYGFRDSNAKEDLGYINVKVRFSPYKKESKYGDMKWWMFNPATETSGE